MATSDFLNIEGLEERAKTLAAAFMLARGPRSARRAYLRRLKEDERVLRWAYRALADDVHRGEPITPATEWLLDNFHIAEAEFKRVRHDLPPSYHRRLPQLAPRELAGRARIYALAQELIQHSDGRLDPERLVRFVTAFQTVAPLTIGELWAWPSMLKLALIENLRRLAEGILEAREGRLAAERTMARLDRGDGPLPPLPRVLNSAFVVHVLQRVRDYGPKALALRTRIDERLATEGTAVEDAIRMEHQRQATLQVSVANTITSLRLCATHDWSRYFESVSLVEQVLQRDPAGVYGRMDFASRDRYRQAVEELADPSGEAQVRVALRAVASARDAVTPLPAGTAPAAGASPAASRASHVGHHLIGRGRRDLEVDVAWGPRPAQRLRRFVFAHATLFYLGAIALFTALGVAAAVVYAGGFAWRSAGAGWIVFLTLVPASQVAKAGIAALNAKHGEGRTDRFFLFHRVRQWNPREGLFMGWERKRGKLEELNRLLRGAEDTSFRAEVGDLSILPHVRYVITLDSDTRLPREVARTLIGII